MSNKARRPWIQDIRSTAGQKMLQDQMDWMWGQLMGNIPEKALGTLFQNKVNSKVGSTEFQTYITQTAEQIALLATQESVNESLEDLATDLNTLTAVADGSLTIWYSATEPAGKVQYDIWFRTTPQPYLIQRWIGGVWVNISSTATARTLVLAYGAQKTADGKIKVYRQTTAPTGLTAIDDGDLWFDTDDSNKLYAWNGSTLAWVSAQDTHLDGDVSAMKTEIIQAANVLRLRASLEETDDLGVAIETVMSEVLITAENITAEVTNKTHYVGALPPALEDLYIGKLWVKTDTDEHLWWKAIGTNTLRSYDVTGLSGTAVEFEDLSDKTELDVTVKVVAGQASGTPSPTSPLAITLKSALTVRKLQNNQFDIGATVTTSGITKTVGTDGGVTLNGTASADVFFNMDLLAPIPGNMVLSANNPVANSGVAIRASTAAGTQVYGLALSSINAKGTAFSGDVRRVVIRVANGTVLSNFVLYPQLEMGSVDTAFEAYTKTDYTLTPDSLLGGLTGYEDEIGSDGHVYHKCAYVQLDNTYTVSSVAALTNHVRCSVTKTGTIAAPLDNTPAISSHFVRTYDNSDTPHFYKNASGLVLTIPKSVLSTYDAAGILTWLNTAKPQFVYQRATQASATVVPVQIDGVIGTNVVTSDGVSVVVDYLGSGWGLVSRESRRVYASSKFIIDENGATVRHVLLDGVTPYEAWTHLYGGGLEIFEESTGEFIGGLCVRGGKVVLAASALTDPRVSTNFMLSPYTIEGGSATEFGVKLSKGDVEALTISTSTPNADPDNPSSARIKSPEIIEILSGASYTGAYSQIDMRPTGTMYIVVKKMSGGTPLYTGFAFNVTDERIEITGHLVPPTNGGYSIGTPSLGFNYYYGTHTSIQSTSDERAKRDMHTLDPDTMLRFIMALDATWYRLNVAPEDLMAGFRAQQFLEAMKLAGIPLDYAGFNGKDSDHLALDYCQVIAPLVSAFQSQQRRIDTIERKLNTFMRRNGPA